MDSVAATSRASLWKRLASAPSWDVVVIGGGATGLGVALDAAARGYAVALIERDDFAKGTSSRATKLVHGGVRYLAQGHLGLVREALRERACLLRNAPHLAQPLPFLLPLRGGAGRILDRWKYGLGLGLYDALAGRDRLGRTSALGRRPALLQVPGLRPDGLAGALRFVDGQFDDARLALALARTAIHRGATVLNHCAAVALSHDDAGRVTGVIAEDRETGARIRLASRCVVNATGVWVDAVRQWDDAASAPLVSPSQGVHLVVDHRFLGGDHAVLVPRTEDGRVMFAIPWLGHAILGTTDTPRGDLPSEPVALHAEVDFILREAGRQLAIAPTRADVRSVWVGLRPLVRAAQGSDTKRLSREHAIEVSRSGLVTVTGGKWTTYRAMAEAVLARCSGHGLIGGRRAGVTASLRLVGAPERCHHALSAPAGLHLYGTEADRVRSLPGHDRELAPGLTEAMVRFAAREEMARSVEDVLARRSRWLFLDAARAAALAPRVAELLSEELGPRFDAAASQRAFADLARQFATPP
ncbi:MAG: glycerol-3-phosphate dehydrogenase/oxidase [Burkholderiales bacterium]